MSHFDQFNKQANECGLLAVECDPDMHWQLRAKDGTALVDIWPTKSKFRVTHSSGKAKFGTHKQAICAALNVLERNKPQPVAEQTNTRNPVDRFALDVELRDYFAASFIIPSEDCGMLDGFSQATLAEFAGEPIPTGKPGIDWVRWYAKAEAVIRYAKADAMLAERKKGQSQ